MDIASKIFENQSFECFPGEPDVMIIPSDASILKKHILHNTQLLYVMLEKNPSLPLKFFEFIDHGTELLILVADWVASGCCGCQHHRPHSASQGTEIVLLQGTNLGRQLGGCHFTYNSFQRDCNLKRGSKWLL